MFVSLQSTAVSVPSCVSHTCERAEQRGHVAGERERGWVGTLSVQGAAWLFGVQGAHGHPWSLGWITDLFYRLGDGQPLGLRRA